MATIKLINPNTNLIADHLHCVGRVNDFYSLKYDNFIVPGDLNIEISNAFFRRIF